VRQHVCATMWHIKIPKLSFFGLFLSAEVYWAVCLHQFYGQKRNFWEKKQLSKKMWKNIMTAIYDLVNKISSIFPLGVKKTFCRNFCDIIFPDFGRKIAPIEQPIFVQFLWPETEIFEFFLSIFEIYFSLFLFVWFLENFVWAIAFLIFFRCYSLA